MVVQGVRLTAPAGQCTGAAGDAGPCWQRLLGSWVLVGNASVQEQLASPQWAEAVKAMAALNATGAPASRHAPACRRRQQGGRRGGAARARPLPSLQLMRGAGAAEGLAPQASPAGSVRLLAGHPC